MALQIQAGDTLAVNTQTAGIQYSQAVTGLAGGGFVVAWYDGNFTYGSLKAQLFDAAGNKVGGEFQVNTGAMTWTVPDITALPGGGFAMTWFDDGDGSRIRAQIFDAAGGKVGEEISVNSYSGSKAGPVIAGWADGSFVIAWYDWSGALDDRFSGIHVQRFDASGAKVGAEFLANVRDREMQSAPGITVLADGSFVVTWEDSSHTGGDDSLTSVKAQIFDTGGAKIGTEFLVNTQTADFQSRPVIASLQTGGFVIAWVDESASLDDTSESSIKAQIFDVTGSKVGREFLVNTQTAGYQNGAAITVLADGSFIISWRDVADAAGGSTAVNIKAQVFDAWGGKLGGEFMINPRLQDGEDDQSISALADGRFVAAWTDFSGDNDGTSFNIKARIFSAVVTGGVGDDIVTGTDASETLSGGNGHDRLTGGGGHDLLQGDAGNDTLYGEAGDDTLSGGTGNDTVRGGRGDDHFVFAIGDGQDEVVLEGPEDGHDIIEITGALTFADVRFTGQGDNLVISYGTGGDRIILDGFFNTWSGIEGNLPSLRVGGETRALTGGWVLEGGANADTLFGTRYDDTLSGLAGSDSLAGGPGNDSLLGGARWDTLEGGAGNDTLDGGSENDRMYGGAGNDLYYIDNTGDRVFEDQDGGNDTVISSVDWLMAANVENLALVGPAALVGTGNGLANRITGNELANTLSGGASDDTLDGGGGADSLDGGRSNDLLLGGARWDTLIGGDGNDTLDGGLDNDVMYGGLGNDVYYVDHIGDRVNESTTVNEGNDTVYASISWNMTAAIEAVVLTGTNATASTGNSLNNTMTGSAGNNTLIGGSGNDTINGGDGDDSLDGGIDSDLIDGGNGNDTILGGQRWDTLTGGAGDDVIDGGTENDKMTGGTGNDTYYIDHVGDRVYELAGEGTDTVYSSIDWAMMPEIEHLFLTGAAITASGNGLNNRITGNTNANAINGGNGNDTLTGGLGNDSLTGGTGRDDFVFSNASTNGTDRISDFLHTIDRLVFTAADYGFTAGQKLTAAQFTTGNIASGTSAQFVWDAATGHLYWDADGTGSGTAVDLAVLDGGAVVTKEDLYFV